MNWWLREEFIRLQKPEFSAEEGENTTRRFSKGVLSRA